MMKRIKVIFLFLVGCALTIHGCLKQDISYKPEKYLEPSEQTNFVYSIARYLAKMPERADYENRFESEFDDYYRKMASGHRLEAYFIAETGDHYFLISRHAPSLKPKRVATGGRLRYGPDDSTIVYYEEVFRTWKMEEEEMKEKSNLLFDKMVRQEDLSRYYTDETSQEEYIQFPDKTTRYNTEDRRWELIADISE